jgi:hypothetical protein
VCLMMGARVFASMRYSHLAMASLPTLVITAVAEATLASGVEVVYVETPAKVFCP